ncbi:MAG: EscR/YscR/HrcR family type III secretion system export apparatus protein [Comamonadaceae bacterium]|nr:MAG: EscR/YscR/HrcR family type III secretion system export apparatus protein [Comamonadaceae bacterium]
MFELKDVVGGFLVITLLGLAPIAIMTLTSFTKIVVVLTLVRNALGVQQVPSTMVINGLALILTMYILAPIGMVVSDAVASHPTQDLTQRVGVAMDAGREPYRSFLAKHAHERERRFFMDSAAMLWPPEQARNLKSDDLIVLAPAFVVSELTEAFRIGFLLYLAFVIVDLVVANVLVALGLQQASPTNIAIPFKLLLFVVLDGWSVLLNGLVATYR